MPAFLFWASDALISATCYPILRMTGAGGTAKIYFVRNQ